jgi:hypothetical protein
MVCGCAFIAEGTRLYLAALQRGMQHTGGHVSQSALREGTPAVCRRLGRLPSTSLDSLNLTMSHYPS